MKVLMKIKIKIKNNTKKIYLKKHKHYFKKNIFKEYYHTPQGFLKLKFYFPKRRLMIYSYQL